MLLNQSLPEMLSAAGFKGNRFHCPICDPAKQHSTSLRITDRSYRCYRCKAEGGIKDCLKIFNISSLPSANSKLNTGHLLTVPWVVYARKKEIALRYLQDRGYPQQVANLEFGYAEPRSLQENGLSLDQIKQLGLGSSNGCELFQNRVVFPIRNERGTITHYQARATSSDSPVKWLASIGTTYGPISQTLYGLEHLKEWDFHKTIFLCEGISDALAIQCLGLPAVASFGIQSLGLNKHQGLYNFNIVAVYDSDRYPISTNPRLGGKYKSWSAVAPQLVELQRELNSDCEIYTVDLPKISGVKDIFDFCAYLDWNRDDFLELITKLIRPLPEKIIELYGLDPPIPTVKYLAGLRLTPNVEKQLTQAVLKHGGWLDVFARCIY